MQEYELFKQRVELTVRLRSFDYTTVSVPDRQRVEESLKRLGYFDGYLPDESETRRAHRLMNSVNGLIAKFAMENLTSDQKRILIHPNVDRIARVSAPVMDNIPYMASQELPAIALLKSLEQQLPMLNSDSEEYRNFEKIIGFVKEIRAAMALPTAAEQREQMQEVRKRMAEFSKNHRQGLQEVPDVLAHLLPTIADGKTPKEPVLDQDFAKILRNKESLPLGVLGSIIEIPPASKEEEGRYRVVTMKIGYLKGRADDFGNPTVLAETVLVDPQGVVVERFINSSGGNKRGALPGYILADYEQPGAVNTKYRFNWLGDGVRRDRSDEPAMSYSDKTPGYSLAIDESRKDPAHARRIGLLLGDGDWRSEFRFHPGGSGVGTEGCIEFLDADCNISADSDAAARKFLALIDAMPRDKKPKNLEVMHPDKAQYTALGNALKSYEKQKDMVSLEPAGTTPARQANLPVPPTQSAEGRWA